MRKIPLFIGILVVLSQFFADAKLSKGQQKYAIRKEAREVRAQKRRKSEKLMTELTIDELQERKNLFLAKNNKVRAKQYVEHMLTECEDLGMIKQLKLELADLEFDLGELEKAEELYKEYTVSYPSSDKTEYVEYKSILSCFYSTLESDRDQTKTQDAIKLAQKYLTQPLYTAYQKDVKIIREQCHSKLLDSEINIVHFYIDNNKLKPAEQRIAQIREEFKDKVFHLEARILALECTLAEKEGNMELAQAKKAELAVLQMPEINPRYANIMPKKPTNYTKMF